MACCVAGQDVHNYSETHSHMSCTVCSFVLGPVNTKLIMLDQGEGERGGGGGGGGVKTFGPAFSHDLAFGSVN